tara:strand:+ start:283 stop:744 length:462 start_codon:yes stop_codon:yes gene_type:complete
MVQISKLKKITLETTNDKRFDLKKIKNKLLIYIYPKDNTPGCTLESLDFKKNYKKFKKYNTEVIGISKDSLESHKKFKNKYKFPFDLLSDKDLKIIKIFKAWGEKKLYGKKYMGVTRTTILINKKLKIIKIWNNVKVKGHVNKVLEYLESIKE